jgi:excisionase family DNA binding protein
MSELTPLALAPADAARFLAISKRTLSRLIRDGRVTARRTDGRLLIDTESLRSYYDSLPVGPHAPVRVRS